MRDAVISCFMQYVVVKALPTRYICLINKFLSFAFHANDFGILCDVRIPNLNIVTLIENELGYFPFSHSYEVRLGR